MRAAAWVAALLAMSLAGCRSGPREVLFVKATRQRMVSDVATNGRAEPTRWVALRAPAAGSIETVEVKAGERVRAGAPIARFEARQDKLRLEAAETRIAQARAELAAFDQGANAARRQELEAALSQTRLALEAAREEAATLERLERKQAATREEVRRARENVLKLEDQLQGTQRQLTALETTAEREAAAARLREAEIAAQAARAKLERAVLRTPIDGVVYELEARPGSFVGAGAELARIGRLDQLTVKLFVDEPELGRVRPGMPVTITWDALPGREWQGEVERGATQIVPLGSRQVGEVICSVANAGLDLIPGANINAQVRSAVVEDALSIPKEALRVRDRQTGVYVEESGRAVWRDVETGIATVTRVEIKRGLNEGDAVALPADPELRPGEEVTPILAP